MKRKRLEERLLLVGGSGHNDTDSQPSEKIESWLAPSRSSQDSTPVSSLEDELEEQLREDRREYRTPSASRSLVRDNVRPRPPVSMADEEEERRRERYYRPLTAEDMMDSAEARLKNLRQKWSQSPNRGQVRAFSFPEAIYGIVCLTYKCYSCRFHVVLSHFQITTLNMKELHVPSLVSCPATTRFENVIHRGHSLLLSLSPLLCHSVIPCDRRAQSEQFHHHSLAIHLLT